MHLNFWICLITGFIITQTQSEEINQENFGPKIIPNNVPKARAALGYDKYEHQPVESSRRTAKKFYPYGNNWEQFDVPQINYNFGYNS